MKFSEKNGSPLSTVVIQFVKFGLVGIANNVIFLAVYYLIVLWRSNLYLVGNVVGFLVSTMNAYLLNSRFVFDKGKADGKSGQTLVKTYVTYTISLGISTGLLYLLVDQWGISEKIAPLISLMITVPLNFLLNKLWVYRTRSEKK